MAQMYVDYLIKLKAENWTRGAKCDTESGR